MVTFIAIATGIMTFIGGALALRLRDKLHLILGFSAGAVIGVAFFDLLPESIELGSKFHPIPTSLLYTAIGFLLYLVVDRMFAHHGHSHEIHEVPHDEHRGDLRAGSMSVHSFLDGIGIGLSFHVSIALGLVVTFAVLAHDFSDGINTVSAVLKNGGSRSKAWRWLIADSLTPIIGVTVAYLYPVSEQTLAVLLSIFAGLFLYIGASDLIPESFHGHPTKWTTIMTIIGAGVIYIVISLAG